jgi:secretion/DNA translocation related CpaE-like protein
MPPRTAGPASAPAHATAPARAGRRDSGRGPAPAAGGPSATALLVTRDDLLLDDLLRLAAAAGCTLEVAHDAPAALRSWAAAAVVLVGADLVSRVAEQRPPRRDHVHVVGHGSVPDEVFRSALAAGAADVVELPVGEAWLVEVLTDAVDDLGGRSRGPALTVGVVAGSGGAGATTFACALALTAASRHAATLLDLDPLGPGVDRVVGLDEASGVRWEALVSSRGRLGSRSLRAALPVKDGLAVLTWRAGTSAELDAASVREVVSAAQRGNDVVVADLPRAVDELSAEVVTRCHRLLVVVEPSVPGVASAGKLAGVLRPLNARLGAVVRTGRGALPPAHVAEVLGLPLVTVLPRHRRLAEHVDLGLGPVHGARSPLARAARAALAAATSEQATS